MKSMLVSLATFMCAILTVIGSAQAQALITGAEMDPILDIARGYGSVELTKQKDGNPLINGRINGIKYGIYFYTCKEGENCSAMQFYAGFKITDVAATIKLQRVNEWNRTKRFGRAYIDGEGDIAIEYDINLAHGITRANLDDNFDYWKLVSGQAEEFFKF